MKILSTILFSLLACNTVLGQFTSQLEFSSFYDDNIYRSPLPTTDILSELSLNLGYQPENSDFHMYYNGSFLLYNELNARNFSIHGLGFVYYAAFGDSDIHRFYLGTEGSMRLDGEEYMEYDYNQIYAYANFRFELDNWFLKTGYNFRYRNYSNVPEISNLRHYLFAQVNKSFTSRTTIILESDIGYKSFVSNQIYTYTEEEGGGRGGMGPGSSAYPTHIVTTTAEVLPMGQAILLARIAQSIYDQLGLYFQYRQQISLTDQITSITSGDYYQDEELFDDPFSYESRGFSSQITWLLPWMVRLQIGGSMIDKNYINEQAYVSVDDTVGLGGDRVDNQRNYYLNISKTFNINKNWLNALTFNFYFDFINNKSNSYWYDYKNSTIGGGLQWRF